MIIPGNSTVFTDYIYRKGMDPPLVLQVGRTVEYGAQIVCHSWRCWTSRIPYTLFYMDPTWTPMFILERSAGTGSHLSVIRAPPCSKKLNFLLPLPSLSHPFYLRTTTLFFVVFLLFCLISLRLCQLLSTGIIALHINQPGSEPETRNKYTILSKTR
jgi:hypothetical protein